MVGPELRVSSRFDCLCLYSSSNSWCTSASSREIWTSCLVTFTILTVEEHPSRSLVWTTVEPLGSGPQPISTGSQLPVGWWDPPPDPGVRRLHPANNWCGQCGSAESAWKAISLDVGHVPPWESEVACSERLASVSCLTVCLFVCFKDPNYSRAAP